MIFFTIQIFAVLCNTIGILFSLAAYLFLIRILYLKSLIVASQGPEAHVSSETAFDEDAAVFFLEFLIKVVLQNRYVLH